MDLTTKYMGLSLRNPLVASAGPHSMDLDKAKALTDAGISAVVLSSLFEEQIRQEAEELEYFLHYGADRFAESLSFYPDLGEFKTAPEVYLSHVRALKEALDVPVIASLNGVSNQGWTEYARLLEEAGADAIELNVSFMPTNLTIPGEVIETAHVDIVKSVRSEISIPLAVKMSPFFSAPAAMAKRLVEAGANGLVLFNRFYEPDINVQTMEVTPKLSLSTSVENRLPLRWTAILFGHLEASLAASTGIHTGEDVAKMLLAGADVAMMTAALLKNGPGHAATVLADLEALMTEKGYGDVGEMRGALSHANCAEPGAFERANYIKMIGQFAATGTRE